MDKININSNEIGTMWTQYIQNSLYVQILKYFLETVDDEQTKNLVQNSINLSDQIVKDLTKLFKDDNIPIPKGFNGQDVNLNADKLFLDPFMVQFLEHTLKAGMLAHGSTLMTCVRKDIRDLFTNTTKESIKLYNQCIDLALEKGLLVRPPSVQVQPEVEFVKSQKYMSLFSNRPLNTVELTHLFENIKTNTVGIMITMSSAQTTDNQVVKEYMLRGMKISEKHVKTFRKIIEKSYIDVPMGSNSYITNSTEKVFSDKLIMHFMAVLSAAGQGNYATASTASMRSDITLTYQRLSAEIAMYAKMVQIL
ncbi:DUF3231 family protein [Piscibacillus salipiscarius]|uniref:DUF3231 family protein n=1 Tax=Piscibacillus salipiscarius TaxID=299480 RepID=UPI002436B7C5|nr:DUF3231 family protein [Piscibacillus salipiscarius]